MALWDDLITVAPGTGLGGMVIGLFAWTLRMGREDRAEYRAALKEANEAARVSLADERTRCAADRAAADVQVSDLRRRLADSQTELDAERLRRRETDIKIGRLEVRLAAAYERLADHQEGVDS